MSEAMIQCQNLTKRFGTFTAVDHVTFSVEKGSIFGFLGPNGSGKSTVIRMLCGILQPTEGKATVGGIDVSEATDELKEIIGYMSQKFSLYDELTVHENLQFYGRLYGLKRAGLKQRMDELIALTHLEPYMTRRAALVSGVPDDLKAMPQVNPPGTRRLDVTCDHVTVGLQALRHAAGVRNATVFGQSMHLLVDEQTREETIRAELARVGITNVDIRPIGPSLEDVFVALTAQSNHQLGAKAA